MFSKFRSLIFKLDPETAHDLAIKSLKFNFTTNIFNKNKNEPIFKTILFGKQIDNPIGMAAGFDKNAEVYNSLFRLGFGFVEVGTVTPQEQLGNPKPRIFRLEEDEGLINRLGFNNLGAKNINSRIRLNAPKGPLGINIGPNKDSEDRLNDYLIGLRKFYDIVDYITINISSPNTESLRNFHDEKKFDELINFIEKGKKNELIEDIYNFLINLTDVKLKKKYIYYLQNSERNLDEIDDINDELLHENHCEINDEFTIIQNTWDKYKYESKCLGLNTIFF